MSTTAPVSPAIEMSKRVTAMGKDRLLKTLSFVSDDKLTWSPEPTSKCALRIAAHCGISNRMFVAIIKRTPFPEDFSMADALAQGKLDEEKIETREQAIALIESSTAAVIEALEAVSPEDVHSDVVTPVFTAPLMFFMNLPGRHMDNHASQIDYIQTCWGDLEWHM